MNILKKIVRVLALYTKKRRLKKQLKLYHSTSVENNLSKTIISDGANLTFDSKSKDLVQRVNENVKAIVIQSGLDVKKLLGYAEASGTHVYRIYNAAKLLKNIGEEEGFISEKKGFDAIYLSIITMSGIKMKTSPMFVFDRKNIERYLVLYSFYRWYSMKSGLCGFEYEIQKKYNKYMRNLTKADISNLPLEEIIGLQDAIARDKEATDFVLNYEKETEVAKKVSDKISQDGSASV